MAKLFHRRIQSALSDSTLQAALDGNAERRNRGRGEALASLPDPQALRQRAHAVRADVIANLDRYLDQFIQQTRNNGCIVHRAADGVQAAQTILDICRQSVAGDRQPLIAKSKTMVSEEIHLNHALEAAGMRVVETDLGEYIIQLRGEPPSHIITPAVHLVRAQVGQLFHEKLGVPYTDEIPVMTNTARRMLRQVFLTADVGISGVNFGVAETGTLCLVTNEGNGRMVTTLPKVHIALMGMERLVPTLDDLALMLSLLPRSATGQKLSVYTSLIHSPRRASDSDGPSQRHLVILDNGRSIIRNSPFDEVLYCVRCGACLNACPVFREIGGHAYVGVHGEYSIYPGPVGSVLAPALFGANEFGHLARASSLCGACKEACPVDIDLPRLLLRTRAGHIQKPGSSTDIAHPSGTLQKPAYAGRPVAVPGYLKWGLRTFTLISTHPRLFGISQRVAGVVSHLVAPRSPWIRLPAFTGWGYNKDIPRPAARPFRARWNSHPSKTRPSVTQGIPFSSPTDTQETSQITPSSFPLPSRLAYELTALGVIVTFCQSGELAGRVLDFLGKKNLTEITSWGNGLPPGLLETIQAGGIRIKDELDPTIRAGLTGALAAIADTGTLVLTSGQGRPLATSLLPEIHIVILRARDIHENLSQVLKLIEVREASSLVLVTGPSRTADIEMALTIGVHGPGEVHVFCVA